MGMHRALRIGTRSNSGRANPLGALALSLAILSLLAGCATPSADGPTQGGGPGQGADTVPQPAPPTEEVLAQGTVLQHSPDAAQLCLGAVAESYPPQCGGPEIVGWDWSAVEQEESASGVTWGAYAIRGWWDGDRFERAGEPIPLSLYDPGPIEPDPRLDESNPGPSDEPDLVRIQEEVHRIGIPGVLSSAPMNGYLFVQLVWDDGTIQRFLDERYGPDVVIVEPALRPAG